MVQIFDYGVDDGAPYIAMELLQGESLAKRLRRDGTLTPEEALRVITHVCRAVGKAHQAGIVHRDLKPDNVFIVDDEDGVRCKVLDFGIAKGLPGQTVDADTRSGAMLGTPYYMAPEQARDSSRADARADLWSVAVIAYECLVGERPFAGESVASVSVKILVDPIPVPSEHGDVPPGFDAWFERATQRDPDDRYQTARELARELAPALGLDVPTATTVTPPPPPARRRSRVGWAGLAALAALVGAGFVLASTGDTAEPADASKDAPGVDAIPTAPTSPSAAPTTPAATPNAAAARPNATATPNSAATPNANATPAAATPSVSAHTASPSGSDDTPPAATPSGEGPTAASDAPQPAAASNDTAPPPAQRPGPAKPGHKKKPRKAPAKPTADVDDLEF